MPSREETETVITWTSADEKATVYSLHPRVWRMCERAGGEEIRKDEGVRAGKKEARTYLVDVGLIRIGRRRKLNLSEEARAKLLENLRHRRRHPTSPESPATESREKTADTHEAEPTYGEEPAHQQNHRLTRRSRQER